MILAIFAVNFGSVLTCIATNNAASAASETVLCGEVTIYANEPTNNCFTVPTITYSGSTATVLCQSEVSTPTGTVPSYASYNTNIFTSTDSIDLTCVGTTWVYTATAGAAIDIVNVYCTTPCCAATC